MATIEIPNGWTPRKYQLGLWRAMDEGKKRAVCVWHRRAGKDLTAIHRTVIEALRRKANYFHCLPIYNQGRKAVWDGKDYTGRPFLDAFPPEIVKRRNNSDMIIELVNGSQWQVVGADNIDRIVGVNLGGVVFSEWSIMNPLAFDYLRPVLRENDAWAIFLYTPRGKNHGYDLYKMAEGNPDWFSEILTVEDTGSLTPEDIQQDRSEGMSEELIAQEYYCNFSAATMGSYYGRMVEAAYAEGRIGPVPYNPTYKVHTGWDIGYDDSTAIWFFQVVGGSPRLIHYIEHHGEGLPYYAQRLDELSKERGYQYGKHFGPHDLEQHQVATGRTTKSIAADLGIRFTVITRIKTQADGINLVRSALPVSFIDEVNCKQGVRALENYHQEYDAELKKWADHPEHDWSSHGCKAFESLAAGLGQLNKSGTATANPDDLRDLYLQNAPPSVRMAYGR